MRFYFCKRGDYYYFLCNDGIGVREIYRTECLSFLIDTRLGSLYKHGDCNIIEQHFDDLRAAGFPVVIMSSKSWAIEEANKFIAITGYCLRYYNREYSNLVNLEA